MKYFVTIAKFAFKVCKFAANIKELLYVHLFSRVYAILFLCCDYSLTRLLVDACIITVL